MSTGRKRLITGGGIVALAAVGLALWHTTSMADTDDLPNQASIAVVRAHPLTPGTIATVHHLASRGGCATSIVSYQSDGLKEYALVQRPATRPGAGGYPVVIFAHGYTPPGTYRTDNTQYAAVMNWYCGHHYLIFKPDYRGHGASQGVADNGLYSPVDTYDVLNLAASLSSYPLANPNRIALIGHSMGGGIVLRAAVAPHNLPIKAVVTMAGAVGTLHQMTYHWTGHVPADVAHKRLQVMRIEGPPSQNPAYWQAGDATNYLASLTAPIQINQGLADNSVPPSFAKSLDTSLSAAGKVHQYYIYPGAGHMFASPAAMNLFLTRSLSFVAHYDQ